LSGKRQGSDAELLARSRRPLRRCRGASDSRRAEGRDQSGGARRAQDEDAVAWLCEAAFP